MPAAVRLPVSGWSRARAALRKRRQAPGRSGDGRPGRLSSQRPWLAFITIISADMHGSRSSRRISSAQGFLGRALAPGAPAFGGTGDGGAGPLRQAWQRRRRRRISGFTAGLGQGVVLRVGQARQSTCSATSWALRTSAHLASSVRQAVARPRRGAVRLGFAGGGGAGGVLVALRSGRRG